jgi:hypothetical protein
MRICKIGRRSKQAAASPFNPFKSTKAIAKKIYKKPLQLKTKKKEKGREKKDKKVLSDPLFFLLLPMAYRGIKYHSRNNNSYFGWCRVNHNRIEMGRDTKAGFLFIHLSIRLGILFAFPSDSLPLSDFRIYMLFI